jgi:hypothetical protein
MTIFVYGDSFSELDYRSNSISWVVQLEKCHSIKNRSIGGASNHYIFLKFMEDVDNITTEDMIVICWSDYIRYYSNDPKKVSESGPFYYKYFSNDTLLNLQSLLYLDKIKAVVKERNLKMLFIWAFPTAFEDNKNWTEASHIRDYQLRYSHSFDNEVRPALMYFSRKEIPTYDNVDRDVVADYFRNDPRPNHLGDKKIHNELVSIVNEVYQSKTSGRINLKDRLNKEISNV